MEQLDPSGWPRHRGARASVLLFGKRWGESRINGVVDSGPDLAADSSNGLYWRTGAHQAMTAEERRLKENQDRSAHWRRWGPYLSERQWGTVREDYSPDGTAWEYFPHDHARSRAYRWGEDGLAGICDRHQRLCFALALWNGRDPILKERLFGLTGNEGNHGEDVKEYYFYLDSTPTHSYMKCLYKYPQAAFPYARPGRGEPPARPRASREFELLDTGVFDGDRYFDVVVEYAKAGADDILIRITATNRGPEAAPLHLLPTLWFRNTWSWDVGAPRPRLRASAASPGRLARDRGRARRPRAATGSACEGARRAALHRERDELQRLFGACRTRRRTSRTAFNDYVVDGRHEARESRAGRHQGRRALSAADRRRARPPPAPPAPDRRRADARSVRHGLRRDRSPQRARGGRRVLRARHRRTTLSDDAPQRACARPSPACCGASSSTTTTSSAGCDGDPTAAAAAGRSGRHGRNSRLDAPLQRRRHLDARQVGVPVVRRLGPGLPLHPARAGRPRLRQGAARSCSCASGTCTPTARSRPTSGRSATSTRRCTPGRPGASTRSIAA